jgi:hypothetical protein
MKYKIILGGRGSENYIYKLTSEQYDQVSELDLEEIETDDILPIIQKEDPFDTDDIICGAYNDSDCLYITIHDESGQEIWNSDSNGYLNQDYIDVYNDSDYLVVQDNIKGQFKEYELDLNEIDPSKLTLIVNTISNQIDVVTGLKYDNVELDPVDYGDYWSKGLYFHLI